MHAAMQLVDLHMFAALAMAFMSQPAPIGLSRHALQAASATHESNSVQQFVVRHESHAGLLDVRPVAQIPVEQLAPSQLFAQPTRACASATPAELSVWHFIWQAMSVQGWRQSSSAPQSVPVSHAASSAQHAIATQSWQVASLLHSRPPQLAAPPVPVVFDPVVFDPVVFDPVVFDPVVFDPVVFDPVVFDPVVLLPVPPVPPVSPVVLAVAGLLPHAATANIETTIAPNAQDFMLMPPTTRDVRSWSPPG